MTSKNTQYIFSDFILQANGVLQHKEKQINLPPKELSVLVMLLECAGELVTKDKLLDHVWSNIEVSEESLTRCIHALRKALLEDKNNRYIDTIYGKGYRFSRPVASVALTESPSRKCTIALLPFHINTDVDTQELHDALVQGLLHYSPYGLTVLPATITQDCHSPAEIITLIEMFRPDYYLAGHSVISDDKRQLRIELVKANNHQLVHREMIDIGADLDIGKLQRRLASTLPRYIPDLNWGGHKAAPLVSRDVTISYLNARYELHLHTPSSLRRALTLFKQCLSNYPDNAMAWCGLAECYLAQAQLGLFDQKHALQQAQIAVDKALALDHYNPLTIALLALLSSLNASYSIADSLFIQALLLAPEAAEVHYYHAWHLLLSGRLNEAITASELSVHHAPTLIAASILNIWLCFLTQDSHSAIALGKTQLCQYAQEHPILQNLLAVILSWQGDHKQALELAQAARESGEEAGVMCLNYGYVHLMAQTHGAHQLVATILENIDSRQIQSAVLPIVLQHQGLHAATTLEQEIATQTCPWLSTWRHDPRLSTLYSSSDALQVA
ncbi:HilA/EilA family virulence transcriptional regulator [Iodobacter fluviatilis]|jgi:DNA-binding winged helix-turn-helix (wHTH) protein|uniref:Transcriptional regulator HilA n=1 Tax=Iodobacter fluviatilis TaxID=537 RepID=A0A7G3G5Z0_9NEIS|nr:HilA/EilA family virulence transcriptional regulator [Iodobacter fluviatilis]QBC42528.1 transcriptional regulator HilA [Iodobacter fluviatilis]